MARLGRTGTRGRCGCWRGRRGIWRHAPSFHVAGVALGDIDIYLRFTWQAWYLVTSTSTFAWQAWHVWHWAGCDGALGPDWAAGPLRLLAWQAWHLATCTLVPCGMRGTRWHRISLLRGRPGNLPSHNLSSHNLLTHTKLVHTQTHNLSSHNLSTHTTCHTQLVHTQTSHHTTC